VAHGSFTTLISETFIERAFSPLWEAGTLLAAGHSMDVVVRDVFLVDDGSCVIRNSIVGASVEGIGEILTMKGRWHIENVSVGVSECLC